MVCGFNSNESLIFFMRSFVNSVWQVMLQVDFFIAIGEH